mmetsp:Transcript_29665/g.58257  ORF Transcript_29665/g.58257 Transcript_29665/m.58257 type:complete len:258 (-) Transcript_29665:4-777(-)
MRLRQSVHRHGALWEPAYSNPWQMSVMTNNLRFTALVQNSCAIFGARASKMIAVYCCAKCKTEFMGPHTLQAEHAEASKSCKPLHADELERLDGGDSERENGQVDGLPSALEDIEVSQQRLTTVVVRNIPRNYHVLDLLSELKLVGFLNFVTLVNLPEERKKNQNRGYAFINLWTADAAFCFRKALNGHQWHESSETAMADWAVVQGHEANAALAEAPPPGRSGVRKRGSHRKGNRPGHGMSGSRARLPGLTADHLS